MRALIRSVTGSPASAKGKAKLGKSGREQHYSISDIALNWNNIKSVFAASALCPPEHANNHASSSSKTSVGGTAEAALSSISQSLDVIVDGLVNEQSTLSSDAAGPCLEYVLTNNVFSNIAQAAVADQPTGVLGLVIRTFDNLVILLGEAFVTFGHRPLNHLLHECIANEEANVEPTVISTGQLPSNAQLRIKPNAQPYEEELASLACSLCSRMKTQADLLPLFFHDKRLSHRTRNTLEGKVSATVHIRNDGSPLSSPPATSPMLSSRPPLSHCSSQASLLSATPSSELSEASLGTTAPTIIESKQYTFLVFDFLIRLLHRHGRTGELARMGLLFIIDLAMSSTKPKVIPTTVPPFFPVLISNKAKTVDEGPPGTARRPSRRPRRKAVIGQSDRLSLLSYIQDSDFADVLAAGLGAALAVLPSRLYVPIPSMSDSPSESHPIPHSPGMGTSDSVIHAMREHSIAICTDSEVKESLELFISIINFAMDVTRKAPKPTPMQNASAEDGSDRSTSTVTTKMQSLVMSIRDSFGSVFLHNALLPRVIDAASPTAEDAAIVAVLTYIDTLINTLEAESPLFEEALSGLLQHPNSALTAADDTSAMRDNLRRILSYSLTAHTGRKTSPNHAGSLSNSLSTSMQLCTLRLLQTFLNKADWTTLDLFSIQPSIGCTAFPFQIPEEEASEDAFKYPEDGDSDRDSFIYPTEDEHRKSIAAFATSSAQPRLKKPSKKELRLDLFLEWVSGTTSATQVPIVETVRRRSVSRHSSRSSLDAPRRSDVSSLGGMSFQKYLKQAEVYIQRDQSFARGIAILAGASERDSIPSQSIPKDLSPMYIQDADLSMNSGTSSLQGDNISNAHRPALVEDRMLQHKLPLHLGLMSQLLALLSTFFINEPAVNLALTATLAKLAICPYRSLCGWLLPEGDESALATLQHLGLLEKLGFIDSQGNEAPSTKTANYQTGNTRVTEWLRQTSYTHQTVQDYEDSGLDTTKSPSILSKYANLLNEVHDSHQSQIKDFHRLLLERRQNMLFVEDLAEAMQIGSATSGSPIESSTSSWHIPFTKASMPSPSRTQRQRVDSSATEREYLNSLSPYTLHLRETSSKLVMVRLERPADDEYNVAENVNTATAGAPLSRFWSATSSHSNQTEQQHEPHTPDVTRESLRSLSPIPERLKVDTNLMLLSDLKSPMGPAGAGTQAIFDEVPVNLSKYLDNLVILEESLKEIVAIIIVRIRIGIDPID